MAVDGFLKLPHIPGESRREGHEDEIEFHALRFGMAAPEGAVGGSVARRGRVTFDPVTVVKRYDRASPYLKRMVAEGQYAEEARLALRRTIEGETDDFLVVVLSGVSVTGYDLVSTEDGMLEEALTLNYRSIRFTYEGDHEVELEVFVGR